MTDQKETNLIEAFNFSDGFTAKELLPLLNHECIHNSDAQYLPEPPVNLIGIVCGILTMNSQVELLVQFSKGIEQLNKIEFNRNYQIVRDKALGENDA